LAIRLIAMDIDGTLLDSQSRLPEENTRAIVEAASRGIEIALVTGRRFDFARAIADALPCDLHMIVSNGALTKSKSGETHQRLLLPIETARSVLQATPEFRAHAGVLFDRPLADQVIFERIDWDEPLRGDYFRRNRKHIAEVSPLTACLNGEDPVQVMFTGPCERMRQAKSLLEALPIRSEYALALTEYEHRDLSILDVLRRGVTKGAALARWAEHRGIARENVMAIGDNWNDREMLEYAGLAVVMGNCVPGLRPLGWTLTLSNDECGVADAIRKYVLRNR
jgi:Cof subfamily protein (haloacid dehalogenase superfamily)